MLKSLLEVSSCFYEGSGDTMLGLLDLLRVFGIAPYRLQCSGFYTVSPNLLALSCVYIIALFTTFLTIISTLKIEVRHSYFAIVVNFLHKLAFGSTGYLGLANLLCHSSALCDVTNQLLALKPCFLREYAVSKFRLRSCLFVYGSIILTALMKCGFFLEKYYTPGEYFGPVTILVIGVNTFAFFQIIYFINLVLECHELLLLINEDVQFGNWRDEASWLFWRQSSSNVADIADTISDAFGLNHVVMNSSCFLSAVMTPLFAVAESITPFHIIYWSYFYATNLVCPLWVSYAATAEVSVKGSRL